MADAKKHAYELIDRLAPTQLSAVVGLLEAMVDTTTRNVPIEDEEISAETAKAIQRGGAPH